MSLAFNSHFAAMGTCLRMIAWGFSLKIAIMHMYPKCPFCFKSSTADVKSESPRDKHVQNIKPEDLLQVNKL